MSRYGLIKMQSMVDRSLTITDLHRVNMWLIAQGKQGIVSYSPSVRALENSVALGLEGMDKTGVPKLERGLSFYESIIPEIKESERSKYKVKNHPQ